jgi:glycosyltransferase involved in cell wall biosynthesis
VPAPIKIRFFLEIESMRILMMCYEFTPIGGGAARVINGLSRHLANFGDDVIVMTMGYRNLPCHEKFNGFQVHRITCIRLKPYYCTIPEVATYMTSGALYAMRLVKIYKPDIIHAHFILPDGLLAKLVNFYSRIPYLITAHETDVPGYNPNRARLAHHLVSSIWRNIAQNAENIICPSQSIRHLVESAFPGARIGVIPNGYETNRFCRVEKKNRILAVPRLLERKGIQYLIQAVMDTDLHWEIVIAGDGPFMNELQQMANASKTKIRFTGWLDNESDELRKLYETSSIFILPSEAENFPICLLEAMSARNAIITTRGTGCKEVVGSTARLITPKDSAAIRKALNEVIENEDLRFRMGELAYNRARSLFDWPIIAQKYRNLYCHCINRK